MCGSADIQNSRAPRDFSKKKIQRRMNFILAQRGDADVVRPLATSFTGLPCLVLWHQPPGNQPQAVSVHPTLDPGWSREQRVLKKEGMSESRVAALYATVSTTDQSCDAQLDELRRFASRRFASYREYVDTGVSGAQRHRPQLDALLRDARRGMFDAVVVWKFDRLARSLKHLIDILQQLKQPAHRFCERYGEHRHHHAEWSTVVLHRRCNGRVRAHFDCRACAGGHRSCPAPGKADRSTARAGRCRAYHPLAKRKPVSAQDCAKAGHPGLACATRPGAQYACD